MIGSGDDSGFSNVGMRFLVAWAIVGVAAAVWFDRHVRTL
jgi:hypothetical protein